MGWAPRSSAQYEPLSNRILLMPLLFRRRSPFEKAFVLNGVGGILYAIFLSSVKFSGLGTTLISGFLAEECPLSYEGVLARSLYRLY